MAKKKQTSCVRNVPSKFVFGQLIPAEVLGALLGPMHHAQFLIPAWCEKVWVSYKDVCVEDQDVYLSIKPLFDYREASLTVYAGWLRMNIKEREQMFVHEIMHIILDRVVEPMFDALRQVGSVWPDPVYQIMRRTWIHNMEGCVQDFAIAFMRRRHD